MEVSRKGGRTNLNLTYRNLKTEQCIFQQSLITNVEFFTTCSLVFGKIKKHNPQFLPAFSNTFTINPKQNPTIYARACILYKYNLPWIWVHIDHCANVCPHVRSLPNSALHLTDDHISHCISSISNMWLYRLYNIGDISHFPRWWPKDGYGLV